MTSPVIRSRRLVLDPFTRADAAAVLDYCRDPELQQFVPVPVPYSLADAEFFTGPYAMDAATSSTFALWAIRLVGDAGAESAIGEDDGSAPGELDNPAPGELDNPALGELARASPPTLVGAIELRFEPVASATLGYWLGKPHRGRGIMTEAVRTLVDFAFDPAGFDLGRIAWDAVVGNAASAEVARRNGFRFEGVGRGAIPLRTERRDGWRATLLRDDPREPAEGWPL